MKRGYTLPDPPSPESSEDEDDLESASDPFGAGDGEAGKTNEDANDLDESGEKGHANNFFVMKRRNAFWKIEHRDSLIPGACPLGGAPGGAAGPSSGHTGIAGALLHPLDGLNIPGGISRRNSRSRQFSLQF